MKYISVTMLIVITAAVAYLWKGGEGEEKGLSDESVATLATTINSLPPIDQTRAVTKKAGPHGAYNPHSSLTPEKHIQVALQHKNEGRMGEAFKTLDQAIAMHNKDKNLYAIRGSLFLEIGKTSAALKDLQQAIKIAPEDVLLLTNRAQAYRQFGQIEEALADLDHAIKLKPDLVVARFNRGAIYYSSNEFDRALVEFEQCIAVDPHTAGPYFNRAATRQALGDTEGAKTDLQRFIQLTKVESRKATAQKLLETWKKLEEKTTDVEKSS